MALGVVLGLVVLVGGPLGLAAFIQVQGLKQRIWQLERQLRELGQTGAPAPPQASTRAEAEPLPEPPPPQEVRPEPKPVPPAAPPAWLEHLKANWMVWVGGLSLALAGVFTVKYSVDHGLIGPWGRVLGGLALGAALHGGGHWLSRRDGHSNITAMLAGAGSIAFYAALLAGFNLYQLFGAAVAFSLMALVSLATMALALKQGPGLAALGILGAYLVPALVQTGSAKLPGLFGYLLLVTLGSLLLQRHVCRAWLWWGTALLAGGWLLLTLDMANQPLWLRGLYLATLGYGFGALPLLGWRLDRHQGDALPGLAALPSSQLGRLILVQALLLLGLVLVLWVQPLTLVSLLSALALLAVALLLPRCNAGLDALPWLALAALLAAVLGQGLDVGFEHLPLAVIETEQLLIALTLWALVFLFYGSWFSLRAHRPGNWAALAAAAPVLLMAVAYVRSSVLSIDLYWVLIAATLAFAYLVVANLWQQRRHPPATVASYLAGAHGALTLAMVIGLDGASLSLGLAAQLLSLGWLDRRFRLDALPWVARAVAAVVIIRLSLNPWLLSYPPDLHWPLWTYGGAAFCAWGGARLFGHRDKTAPRLEGAAVHLLVLMLTFEARYWLHDGQVFSPDYNLSDLALNMTTFGALGLVYLWRARTSGHFAFVYRLAGQILLALFALLYVGGALLLMNPLWHPDEIADTPVFNLLLALYALPLLYLALAMRLLPRGWTHRCAVLLGLGAVVLVGLEVRHLWQGRLDLTDVTSNGELYSYSVAWLLLSLPALIYGARLGHEQARKGGMLLLMAVVAKIFLIDMGGLDGLWRVASFLGLGLSLLGIAYLYRQLQKASD
ncbi:DUF2339 domain-containing protein [Gallaecimonas sp. GXIMD4217]|uniref:DUF2339 domain-containing protein n=1 Tax=Gallaecimonas sp. GXIMD4217 TaxID=3131927 RepID=UPI00311B3B47